MVQQVGPLYFGNMSNVGWICPKCARCFSPSTSMCGFCLPPAAFVPNVTVTTTEIDTDPPFTYIPTYIPDGPTWVPATHTYTGVAPLTVGEDVAPLTVGHFPVKK